MPDSLPEIRTSERKLFRRCPQAWYWGYRLGLRPKGEESDALWLGTGVHLALAEWYLPGRERGLHPAQTFSIWAGDSIREMQANYAERDREWYDQPKFVDGRELGIAMLEEYIDHYGQDDDWDILHIEQSFTVLVVAAKEHIANFHGTFDGVVRDLSDGRVYLLEHKTAAQIQTSFLALDDQAGGYLAVANAILRKEGHLKGSERIAGIIYNYLRKSLPDPRPENAQGQKLNLDGSISKKQPAPAFLRETIERAPGEDKRQMERLAAEVEVMQAMRRGEIPIYKNTTRDCTWCTFFDMCKIHEQGRDWRAFAQSEYTIQDPYGPYHKSASE